MQKDYKRIEKGLETDYRSSWTPCSSLSTSKSLCTTLPSSQDVFSPGLRSNANLETFRLVQTTKHTRCMQKTNEPNVPDNFSLLGPGLLNTFS